MNKRFNIITGIGVVICLSAIIWWYSITSSGLEKLRIGGGVSQYFSCLYTLTCDRFFPLADHYSPFLFYLGVALIAVGFVLKVAMPQQNITASAKEAPPKNNYIERSDGSFVVTKGRGVGRVFASVEDVKTFLGGQ